MPKEDFARGGYEVKPITSERLLRDLFLLLSFAGLLLLFWGLKELVYAHYEFGLRLFLASGLCFVLKYGVLSAWLNATDCQDSDDIASYSLLTELIQRVNRIVPIKEIMLFGNYTLG